MRYAELEVTTNFTFLNGGSHPEELAATARALGLEAIAVTDRNTLAGIVRAHLAAKEVGIKFIVGVRLDLKDAPSLLAYPTDRAAYGRLCRLLTLGQRRAEKGECTLFLDDVAAHAEGLIFVALPPDDFTLTSPLSSPGLTGRSSNHRSLSSEGQGLLDARLRGHDKGNFEAATSAHQRGARRADAPLSRGAAFLSRRRQSSHRRPRRARRADRHPPRRHQCGALSRPPPASLAGRAYRHPREMHRPGSGPPPRSQCRAAREVRKRHGAPVRRPRGRASPQYRDRAKLHLLSRRAEIRISRRAGACRARRRNRIWRT